MFEVTLPTTKFKKIQALLFELSLLSHDVQVDGVPKLMDRVRDLEERNRQLQTQLDLAQQSRYMQALGLHFSFFIIVVLEGVQIVVGTTAGGDRDATLMPPPSSGSFGAGGSGGSLGGGTSSGGEKHGGTAGRKRAAPASLLHPNHKIRKAAGISR